LTSLRYHAGRMVLYQGASGWRVRVKTRTGKLDLPVSADELEDAVIEAEQLYADARGITNAQPMCQSCIHWKFVQAECGIGFPEGRSSGGKFASKCCAYWAD
jgi:hypothetical protein